MVTPWAKKCSEVKNFNGYYCLTERYKKGNGTLSHSRILGQPNAENVK